MNIEDIVDGSCLLGILDAWREVLADLEEHSCDGRTALTCCVNQLAEALEAGKMPDLAMDLYVVGYERGAAFERSRTVGVLRASASDANSKLPVEALEVLDCAAEAFERAPPTKVARAA